jgi:2-polyprenyl-6-methoxyphenol hydroxylase-like FAD-dependent oxidoreductase
VLEYSVIQTRGFANVVEDGRVTGFQLLFTQDDDGVDVSFSDGDSARYDLLAGADGLRSSTRAQLGIEGEPQPVGMGIWRVHARRPPDVVRTDLIYDGPCYIAGYCPTGPGALCVPRGGGAGPFRRHPGPEGRHDARACRLLPRALGRHPGGHLRR